MEYTIYRNLSDAFGASTRNNNRFEKAVNAVKWDSHYVADGEHNFVKGRMIFTTQSLDPFHPFTVRPACTFLDSGDTLEL